MKKEPAKDKEKTREVIEGLAVTPDYKIIREVQEDGSLLYYHPVDEYNPEQVKYESLYEVVRTPIRRVRALVELLDDDDHNRFGFVADAIIGEAERLYDDLFHFLDETVGEIEVDVMDRGSVVYRNGRVLGARIKPNKNGSAEEAA